MTSGQSGWSTSYDTIVEGIEAYNFFYGQRFIVTLPASSINLEQGDGVEGNGWGIQ